MIDDPRGKVAKLESHNNKNSSATAEYIEDIDPTSEIENTKTAPKVEVKRGVPVKEELESASKVFKFASEEPKPVVEEIRPVQPPVIKVETGVEEPVEPVKVEPQEPREYKIPDPTDLPGEIVVLS